MQLRGRDIMYEETEAVFLVSLWVIFVARRDGSKLLGPRLKIGPCFLISRLQVAPFCIVSPELYNFRSLLGFTEKHIDICLCIPQYPNPCWFTFTLSMETVNRRLVPVRSNFYQPPEASSMVAHDCEIYIMGSRIGGRASSSVLFLDCRSHTWSTLPSMVVARYSAAAGVVDYKWGRILWVEPHELEWEVMEWREVMGLEALRKTLAASKLVSYGGWLWDRWETCRREEPMLALGLRRLEIDEIFLGHKLNNSGPNMLIFGETQEDR
ncbi:unnamed protein product [Brassica rapa]|uniref:FKB95-like N-terminal Kelch domain-containing protein n=2 Tax=Brassica TaxID=3705 RepID=A0A8D9LSW0_BRACM|nr:unnamed protein product [Brassica napus]CAG7885325.1 unnamed protein product [Brassica rapa]